MSFYHIPEKITLHYEVKRYYKTSVQIIDEAEINIEPGYFNDLKGLINSINNDLNITNTKFTILHNDHISYETNEKIDGEKDHYYLELDKTLQDILGFTNLDRLLTWKDSSPVCVSEYPADIKGAFPKWIFVYTNICEANIVGDVYATILRSIPIRYNNKVKSTDVFNHTFTNPNYVSLISNNFREIEIDLRNRLGKSLPFVNGTSSVTLHFKRVN